MVRIADRNASPSPVAHQVASTPTNPEVLMGETDPTQHHLRRVRLVWVSFSASGVSPFMLSTGRHTVMIGDALTSEVLAKN